MTILESLNVANQLLQETDSLLSTIKGQQMLQDAVKMLNEGKNLKDEFKK